MKQYEKVYACKHKNNDVRYQSTSGGAFMALCEYVIKNKGYVVGVKYDDDFHAVHDIAYTLEECRKFMGSKYSQSRLGNIYKRVKELLEQGDLVMFTGTPCHIAALHSFLNKEYENLILVDIICMGIASPGIWQAYLKYQFPGQIIQKVKLKDKTYGWHKFSVQIKTNQEDFLQVGGKNIFMNAYVSGKIMRKSCYNCKFKGDNRFSDITLGDCWGIETIDNSFDDNKGVSSVFIHTKQGAAIFEHINNIYYIELTKEKATQYNVYYYINRPLTNERKVFLDLYRKNETLCFGKNDPNHLFFKIKNKLRKK